MPRSPAPSNLRRPRRYPEHYFSLAFAARAAQLRRKVRTDCWPTELDQMGQQLGVRCVRDVPLTMAGRVARQPGGYTIELKLGLSPCERRFVIAHEIAHLLIERYNLLRSCAGDNAITPPPLTYRFVEQLCDLGARELLLPLQELTRRLRSSERSILEVRRIGEDAQCSLEIVTRRVCEAWVWNCMFVWWKRHDNRLVPVRATKIEGDQTAEHLMHISLADQETSAVGRAMRSGNAERGLERIRYWDGVTSCQAQALRLDDSVAIELLIRE